MKAIFKGKGKNNLKFHNVDYVTDLGLILYVKSSSLYTTLNF